MWELIFRSAFCTTAGGGGVSSSTASIFGPEPEGDVEPELVGLAGRGLDFTPSAKVRPVRWRSAVDSLVVLLLPEVCEGRDLEGRQTEVAAGKKSRTASLARWGRRSEIDTCGLVSMVPSVLASCPWQLADAVLSNITRFLKLWCPNDEQKVKWLREGGRNASNLAPPS